MRVLVGARVSVRVSSLTLERQHGARLRVRIRIRVRDRGRGRGRAGALPQRLAEHTSAPMDTTCTGLGVRVRG